MFYDIQCLYKRLPSFEKIGSELIQTLIFSTSLSGGNSKLEPPDPISNSEVKQLSADGSVGSPHARVGHRQALKNDTQSLWLGIFLSGKSDDPTRAWG